MAIILRVPQEELWNRLNERGRVDDEKDAILRRWDVFEQTIAKMSKILEANGVKVVEVNGLGKIEQITERIESVLKKWGTI